MKRLFYSIIICFIISGCSDDNNKPGIVGEWKLTEIYDGYANGGNFTWTSVPDTYYEFINFTSNGQYFKSGDLDGTQTQCNGTYQLLPDNILQIESSCQTVLVNHKIELTEKTLIIDIQVIEGVIRRKYTLTDAKYAIGK